MTHYSCSDSTNSCELETKLTISAHAGHRIHNRAPSTLTKLLFIRSNATQVIAQHIETWPQRVQSIQNIDMQRRVCYSGQMKLEKYEKSGFKSQQRQITRWFFLIYLNIDGQHYMHGVR